MNTSPILSVSIALCGSGGTGVMTAANMLLDAVAQSGYHALFSRTAGPQIRGGEAAAMVRISPSPVNSVDDVTDLLVAIDWLNVTRFAAELPLGPGSVILCDPAQGDVPEIMAQSGARIIHLPMKELAKTVPGGRANMIALGAIAQAIGLEAAILAQVLGKSLKQKHADAFQSSVDALAIGQQAAADLDMAHILAPPQATPDALWAITGNQAAGLGAVRGGVRFCAAYPITPATELLEWLAGTLPRLGGQFVQAEDELASIGMCVGASFGGVPALTATSGPGLSLMVEALGMATASETPVVVVDVQRAGPSTGIPTKTEQSDLNIALFGLHGDAPHLVVAPQSIEDCLFTTQWAVHLAESLQTPCIVLSDQSLGQSRAIIRQPAQSAFTAHRLVADDSLLGGQYHRYQRTESGVSPMAIPGTPGGQYTADGLEHGESGAPSAQAADHAGQLDKRLRKLSAHEYGPEWATVDGDGDLAVLCWGSCTGAAREAVERARARGIGVRLIAPRLLSPSRPADMARALDGIRKVLVVEMSHQKQFLRYLRGEYDLPETHCLNRPGPLPIRPAEILAHLIAMGEQ